MLRIRVCRSTQTYPKYKVHSLKILRACLGLQLRVASANIHYYWNLNDRDIEVRSLATSAANETILEATENERTLPSVHIVQRESRCSTKHAHTEFTLAKKFYLISSSPKRELP